MACEAGGGLGGVGRAARPARRRRRPSGPIRASGEPGSMAARASPARLGDRRQVTQGVDPLGPGGPGPLGERGEVGERVAATPRSPPGRWSTSSSAARMWRPTTGTTRSGHRTGLSSAAAGVGEVVLGRGQVLAGSRARPGWRSWPAAGRRAARGRAGVGRPRAPSSVQATATEPDHAAGPHPPRRRSAAETTVALPRIVEVGADGERGQAPRPVVADPDAE